MPTRTTTSFPTSLEDLLWPLSSNEFFREFWNKQFYHIPGNATKFESLFPWSRLNMVLQEHRLRPPRLRLHKNGRPIEAPRYMQMIDGEPRVKAGSLNRELAAGATLILDYADELYRPLTELATALEWTFRAGVNINLYAGWLSDNGFPLHWDKQDTLILQVAGRKHWDVYPATRPFPLKDGLDEEPPTPKGQPIWSQNLEPGCLLYIPRGWWHIAHPLNEPCLHLTITLAMRKGIDLLHWLVDELKTNTEVRRDLPYLAPPEEQNAYLERLQTLVANAWDTQILQRFLAFQECQAFPRANFRLPDSATARGIELHEGTCVRLVRRLALPDIQATDPTITFVRHGRRWECRRALAPALNLLNLGQNCVIRDLCSVIERDAAPALKILVKEMISEGLLLLIDENAFITLKASSKACY